MKSKTSNLLQIHSQVKRYLPGAATVAAVGIALCLMISSSRAARAPLVWIQSSFRDFSQGHFGDAGANTYVSSHGHVETVNRWDLNQDGYIDLVFNNSHPHAEKLDAAIYWGNGKDFGDTRVSYIPNEGSQWTTVADLNGDGKLDAIIPNYTNGTWSDMDSYVYYAGPPTAGWGFPPFGRKVTLPTRAAQKAAVADLNGDSYPDIVFALSAGFWEYRGRNSAPAFDTPVRIFWGSKDGFARNRYSELATSASSDVAIADLNHDGFPDIVVASREKNNRFDVDSHIYWGSRDGYSASHRTALLTDQANAVAIYDLNRDGFADIIFANGEGNSYIYLSDHGQFDPQRRIELATSDSRGCAAADLNGDGFPDIVFTNNQVDGNPETTSFIYWGSASGFSAKGRQELETVGAWGVSIADLNKDGRPDIVFSNYKDYYSYDVPSYVYWNSEKGFSNLLRTSVFTHGAVGNTIADLNGDGNLDIIFNNTASRTRGGVVPVYVYWGNAKGEYSSKHRLEVPSIEPYGWTAADLNDDGWPDLVIANSNETGRHATENYIYWGSKDGFAPGRRSALMGYGNKGVAITDLDRDGYLDVIFYNSEADPTPGILIYWGGPQGFVTTERTELPGEGVGQPTIADLNYDGHLDFVAHSDRPNGRSIIYWGNGTRNYSSARSTPILGSEGTTNSEVADLNKDGYLDLILVRRGGRNSYIYYGNALGEYSVDRRVEFKTLDGQTISVGDLNGDGWLDIVAPSYKLGGSRATLSRVYLGGPNGFSGQRMWQLPTASGTGSLIADFNADGYKDLLLICHRSEGDPNKIGAINDHETNSFIYWGGPDGLRADRRLAIPTRGAHYDGGIDLGNIYDRSLQFDYVSTAFQYKGHVGYQIVWAADTPPGTGVQFQVRTASTQAELAAAPWTGPEGKGSFYKTSGATLQVPPTHSWIQYRAVFTSKNGGSSAVVKEVRLVFH